MIHRGRVPHGGKRRGRGGGGESEVVGCDTDSSGNRISVRVTDHPPEAGRALAYACRWPPARAMVVLPGRRRYTRTHSARIGHRRMLALNLQTDLRRLNRSYDDGRIIKYLARGLLNGITATVAELPIPHQVTGLKKKAGISSSELVTFTTAIFSRGHIEAERLRRARPLVDELQVLHRGQARERRCEGRTRSPE